MAFNYPSYGGYAPISLIPGAQAMMGQPFGQVSPPAQMTSAQPIQTPQQVSQGLSPASRIVANREEAMGVPADFNGNLMVFPDITHNRVFIKRWNYQTGAADFIEYAPQPPVSPQESMVSSNFVPTDVFQSAIEDLRAEIDALKKPAVKGGKKNDPDE